MRNNVVLWVGGAVAAAVVAGVAAYVILQNRKVPEAPVEPPVVEAPAAVEPAPEAAEPAPETAPEVAVILPEFDLVRITETGEAVIAGHAAPEAPLRVLVDDSVVAEQATDSRGNFVAMFTLPPSDATRIMVLESEDAEGNIVVSSKSVIVEPIAAPVVPETPMVMAEAEEPEAMAMAEVEEVVPEAEAVAPETVLTGEPAATEAPEPEAQPAAPRVLIAGADGITVLQDAEPREQALTIDTITYEPDGSVVLTGRASAGAPLRIYLDNAASGEAMVAEDGQWRAPLPDVAPGVYTLRVDELAEDGSVSARVETPFKREAPEALLAAAEAKGETGPLTAITVQPGNTLWGISRARYGEGILYVQVFEANRDQIRNPDLIYPGQVFSLPEIDAGAATDE